MTHENVEVAQANGAKPDVAESGGKPAAAVEGKPLKIEEANGKVGKEAAAAPAAEKTTNGDIAEKPAGDVKEEAAVSILGYTY